MPAYVGTLKITVMEAYIPETIGEPPDPFVTLSMLNKHGDVQHRTTAHKKATHNPVFNEAFMFSDVSLSSPLTATLHDNASPLSSGSVGLSTALAGRRTSSILTVNLAPVGSVKLDVQFVPSGRVDLVVIKGANLGRTRGEEHPDPFVKIRCGDEKFKTKKHRRDSNPTFNERFSLGRQALVSVKHGELSSDTVQFKVYDHDRLTPDTVLGTAEFHLAELGKNPRQTFVLPVGADGRLTVMAELHPEMDKA
ncbi:C2 domain [Carpediemonas membranifera]|uniref:C2 domain n=1 Tax=Carpediemonas membranifera TaxID=201153 RepID=A0A8J6E692_9EUKA|nr:C2 domain [Carpediemonas membranifera]|eukprot:KAG9396817.1 C2 domain [Carpediemonas membranifera]